MGVGGWRGLGCGQESVWQLRAHAGGAERVERGRRGGGGEGRACETDRKVPVDWTAPTAQVTKGVF